MVTAVQIHDLVASVCPIEGVRLGDIQDKSTWVVWYRPSASKAQKDAAQDILNRFMI